MLVEEERLYFCTARGKAFYRQLLRAPSVAVTGMNEKYQMVRLSGVAERLPEQKRWIDRIFDENPAMREVYPGASRYVLEAFCIAAGQIAFFDLGAVPIVRHAVSFGGAAPAASGFLIGDDCVGCGRCCLLYTSLRGCRSFIDQDFMPK